MATSAAPGSDRTHAAAKRYIYAWGGGRAEGDATMRDLLGGKGAGLAEMTNAGLPVPPGFTITTEACNDYFANGQQLPDGLWDDVLEAVKQVEAETGKGFGDAANPLLVSVRSGAKFSMPGMMDTVLNLGLNEDTLQGLVALTGNERFGWDAYRRFIQMFGRIVMDVPGEQFDHALDAKKAARGVSQDTDLSAEDLREVAGEYRAIVRQATGRDFPADPYEQLDLSIKAVFGSWFGKRAMDYRNSQKIAHDLGTAVNVVTMVFGNMGDDSGTGVAFTRDPNTGEKSLFGEYLTNAQGEDVVAGIRTAPKISQMQTDMPHCVRRVPEDRPAARAPLPRRPGPRVHDRARPAVHAPDAVGQADRGRSRADRRRHGRGGPHLEGRGSGADRAGPRRPAPARHVRPGRAQGRHQDRERAQRLAGRRRWAGRLRRRYGRRMGRPRREGHPRSDRDVPGRLPRHGRVAGHHHRPRRRHLARGGRRAPDRQAVRGRVERPVGRLRRQAGALQRDRDRVQGRRLGQPRRLDRRALPRPAADGRGPLRGPARAPDDPRLGRRHPPHAGLDERRQARGGRPGPRLWRAGHRAVPHRAHVPRGRAPRDRARRDPRREPGDARQGEGRFGRGAQRRRAGGGRHLRRRDGEARAAPAGRLRGHLRGDGQPAGRHPPHRPAAPRVPAEPRGAARQGHPGRGARRGVGRGQGAPRDDQGAPRAEPDARTARRVASG